MNAKTTALAVAAAVILAATALSGACVDKVDPCEEYDVFAEIYATNCPGIEAWSTECASNLNKMLPEVRQDFDWCVDCYIELNSDPEMDCGEAPLGATCLTLLNGTLDATTCDLPNTAS